MAVVWYDPLVFKRAMLIVRISTVVNVRPFHEWVWKVFAVIQASMSVMVDHVPQYQFTVSPVIIVFGLRKNLSTDNSSI